MVVPNISSLSLYIEIQPSVKITLTTSGQLKRKEGRVSGFIPLFCAFRSTGTMCYPLSADIEMHEGIVMKAISDVLVHTHNKFRIGPKWITYSVGPATSPCYAFGGASHSNQEDPCPKLIIQYWTHVSSNKGTPPSHTHNGRTCTRFNRVRIITLLHKKPLTISVAATQFQRRFATGLSEIRRLISSFARVKLLVNVSVPAFAILRLDAPPTTLRIIVMMKGNTDYTDLKSSMVGVFPAQLRISLGIYIELIDGGNCQSRRKLSASYYVACYFAMWSRRCWPRAAPITRWHLVTGLALL